ncbi:hypothetical protein ACFL3B_00475 [Gemmatimonadota bacterium]
MVTDKPDVRVPIDGARVELAVQEIAQQTVYVFANQNGLPKSTLQSIVKGNGKRGPQTSCMKSHRDRLARVLGVSPEWLGGEVSELGGTVFRPTYRQGTIKGVLGWRLKQLSGLEQIICSEAGSTLEEIKDAGWRMNSACESLLAILRGQPPTTSTEQLPENLADMAGRLETLARSGERLGRGSTAIPLSAHLKKRLQVQMTCLRDIEVTLKADTAGYNPTRADLWQHRLWFRCWVAWQRDALRANPSFDLSKQDFRRKPWKDLARLTQAIEWLLEPSGWRAGLLEAEDSRDANITTQDWENTTTALARALDSVLEPWFQGKVALKPEALTRLISGLSPRPTDKAT